MQSGIDDAEATATSPIPPLKLLMAQGFLQGGAAALFVAAANTLFLVDHGAVRLPWVYICAAVAIPLMSFGFNSIAERTSVGALTISTLLAIAAVFFGSWAIAVTTDATWVSFVLMVLFFFLASYIVLIQNVQASLFFDVREMKQKAPPMMAAAMIGMVVFGFLTPVLLALFDEIAHLLLIAGVLVVLMAAAARVLVNQHPEAFVRQAPRQRVQAERNTLVGLWRNRYIRTVFSYQFLSSLGTRLILFVFLAFTARKFAEADSLASFIASFNATSRILTVVVLLAVVRPLLQKVGLSFGLLSNPLVVSGVVAVLLVASVVSPDAIDTLFWIAVAARGLDLVFTFSSTEASVRTIYQVFPDHQRVAAITTIEGFSIPLSIGLAGVVLLILDAIDASDRALIACIMVVCVLWVVASRRAVQGYSEALVERIREGRLDPVQLVVDDDDTVQAVIGLLESPEPATVTFALELLEQDSHPSYHEHLMRLLDREPEVAVEAAARLERSPAAVATSRLTQLVDGDSPGRVRSASLRALIASDPTSADLRVQAWLAHDDPMVRDAAIIGALRHSPRREVTDQADQVLARMLTGATEDRVAAAQVVGAVGGDHAMHLAGLLASDGSAEVRHAALVAAQSVQHRDLVSPLIANLADVALRSEAVAALVAQGDNVIPAAAAVLDAGESDDAATAMRMVGVLRDVGSAGSAEELARHLAHPNPAVRHRTLEALRTMRYAAPDERRAEIERQLAAEVESVVEYTTQHTHLEDVEECAVLRGALGEQADDVRSNCFALIGMVTDPETVARAFRESKQTGPRRALAIEAVESLVSAEMKPHVRRMTATAVPVASEDRDPGGVLAAVIATNPSEWTRATAVTAIGELGDEGLMPLLERSGPGQTPLEQESLTWALAQLEREKTQNRDLPDDETYDDESEDSAMLIVEKVALLKQASVFANTPASVMAAVASIATEVHLLSGARLMSEGDPAEDFYVIAEGELTVVVNGTELTTMGPGEMVGELGIFNNEPRAADVTARTDAMLFAIHRGQLAELMADRPEIAQGIIEALSRRLTEQGLLIVRADPAASA